MTNNRVRSQTRDRNLPLSFLPLLGVGPPEGSSESRLSLSFLSPSRICGAAALSITVQNPEILRVNSAYIALRMETTRTPLEASLSSEVQLLEKRLREMSQEFLQKHEKSQQKIGLLTREVAVLAHDKFKLQTDLKRAHLRLAALLPAAGIEPAPMSQSISGAVSILFEHYEDHCTTSASI